jgi:hypothetical protein
LELAFPLLLPLFFLFAGARLRLLGVVAAATVGLWPPRAFHKASAAFTIAADVLWLPAPTVSLMEGRRRMRKVRVWTDSWREMLFEFHHENAGLEALHFHGETKQVKVRLPLALSKLSKQSFFQLIEWLILIIADIHCVENVWKNLLGQARALAYLSFCDLIPAAANCPSIRQNQICGSLMS